MEDTQLFHDDRQLEQLKAPVLFAGILYEQCLPVTVKVHHPQIEVEVLV